MRTRRPVSRDTSPFRPSSPTYCPSPHGSATPPAVDQKTLGGKGSDSTGVGSGMGKARSDMDVSTLQHKPQEGVVAGRVKSKSSEEIHVPKSSGLTLATRPIDQPEKSAASVPVGGEERATLGPSEHPLLQDGAATVPLKTEPSSISAGGMGVASVPLTAGGQELPPLSEVTTDIASAEHFSGQQEDTTGFSVSFKSPFEAEAADVEDPLLGRLVTGGAEQTGAKEGSSTLVDRHDDDKKPSVSKGHAETGGVGSRKEHPSLLDGVGCTSATADLQVSSGNPARKALSPPTTLPETGEAKGSVDAMPSDRALSVSKLDSSGQLSGHKDNVDFQLSYSNPSEEEPADCVHSKHVESVAGAKSNGMEEESRALVERHEVGSEGKQVTPVLDAGASTSGKPKGPDGTVSDN